MYNGRKILAIVPARGGSKGIKNKNIVDLCGKPLIAYTIECAKESKYIDDIIVSTDSELIAEVAIKYGAEIPFMRPTELASDTSKTIDTVMHVLEELQKLGRVYDCLVLLQATQPLRIVDDIDGAIHKYYTSGEQNVVSVCTVDENPILVRTIDENGMLVQLLPVSSTCRRQDMPLYYKVNGCVYVNSISKIDYDTSFNDNVVGYIMPVERSIDIDELRDLDMAKYYLDGKGCK